ncbi:MAG: EamA family transporter [Ignavibacteriales bacterium]|nr:EamA family transporter [Ignavibacteriales bacterium]
MDKPNIRAYIAWIAICILWGTTYLFIRIGVESVPPMLFAGFRWIVAGLILITILKISGKQLPKKSDLIHIAIIGIALLGFGNGLVVVGEQYVESGLAALLITTVPFWMVGVESFLPKGPKLNWMTISGLVVGSLGVGLIFGGDLKYIFETKYLIGVLSILGAVVSWSLGSVYSKYKKVSVHPLMSASVQMLMAGSLQIILGSVMGEFSVLHFTQSGIISLAYLVVFGSILGYGSYIYAIEHLPLSLVSTYAYVNPIIALILGWIFLNEQLSIFTLIAAMVIIVGVVLVKIGSNKRTLIKRF